MAENVGDVPIPSENPSEVPSEVVVDPIAAGNGSGTPHPKPPLHTKRKSKAKTITKNRRKVSDVWEHFTRIPDMEEGEDYATCNYCNIPYACHSKRNGTTTMMRHLNEQCTKFLKDDLKQTVLSFEKAEFGSGLGKLKAVAFNQNEARVQLARMVIIDEFPFRVVEGEGFKAYSQYLQPRFALPYRTTVASDCIKLYADEKTKLQRLMKNQRLCFTTDTWTSVQNLNYMCLTGHWIDKDWVYQKRLLNFCPIADHKGQTIGDAIESCFIEWGIEKVLTITVDNVSSNDAAIRTLKSSNGYMLKDVISNHEFLHMRCCAHIVNLVVQSGLKELNESVVKIRREVKYVKSSPAREKLFNACVKAVHFESKKGLSLDVEIRWNSTYLMLEAAEKYERAFNRLERDDGKFVNYFYSGDDDEADGEGESNNVARRRTLLGSPPRSVDWENARYLVKFLEMFYDVTKKFSASTSVTANEFFHAIVQIQTVLMKFVSSLRPSLGNMSSKMMVKFTKYWGDFRSINGLLYIAIILDPRYKSKYIKYTFEELYSEEKAKEYLGMVDALFARLYEHYQERSRKSPAVGSSSSNQLDIEMENDNSEQDDLILGTTSRDQWDKKIRVDKSVDMSTDLSKYLNDPVKENSATFNLLSWWKVNASKYPIIAEIARDVLAIPISTVASESAFSTGGRVLDPYRSSLKPSTVQALLCTQNWLRSKSPRSWDEMIDPLGDDNIVEELIADQNKNMA